MKKRITSYLLAALMIFMCFASNFAMVARADEGATLKLHYHRADGNYTDWSVWLWPQGGEGSDNAFEANGDEVVATYAIPAGTTSVGFIVRTPDWSKDIDADQFIDISEVVSGTVDIYVESGVEGYTKEYGADAVLGIKLKTAKYQEDGTLTITMTGEIPGDYTKAFTVHGKETDIEIQEVTLGENFTYSLTLAEELDYAKSYFVTYEETELKINMPNIYSTEAFEAEFTYTGDDLGATWSEASTTFRVWAPTAEKMAVNLFSQGGIGYASFLESYEMTSDVNGTWVVTVDGDLNGTYYNYSVTIDGETKEAIDPYARTAGVNGNKAMVINLTSTNPEGWENDVNPHSGASITDAVIYEGHIRDLTVDSDSGIENKGKFLGLSEVGTKTSSGIATGIDHMKELGITHLQILPFYDFGSVNETATVASQLYNWGYDPVNYNVPEGSYSTDPYHGEVRVRELKQMIKALHDNDISVIMDVVYNHVYNAGDFCFNILVPGYFSRINQDGSYSSGSGCGNDTASERSMVKKYIVDSVNYWADEYHIDGFRFDLVGLIDIDTINEIVSTVHETHPDVIFYGEGWTLNTSVTKYGTVLATQPNSEKTPSFAYFNDTIRDGLKGSVFNTESGFVSGAAGKEALIENCFLGADSWCKSPSQTINYVSCHDNNTLYDRLRLSNPNNSDEDIVKMNNLAAAIYMTAQGTPFMQAGEDMLRTKTNKDGTYNSNSYASGDTVNTIDYNSLEDEKYKAVFEYYKGLIAFRKAHSALRFDNPEDVSTYVSKVSGLDQNMTGFHITGDEELYLIFNANNEVKKLTLPDGNWNVYVDAKQAGTTALQSLSGEITVDAISALILMKEDAVVNAPTQNASTGNTSNNVIVYVVLALVIVAVIAGVVVIRKRKKN